MNNGRKTILVTELQLTVFYNFLRQNPTPSAESFQTSL